MKLTWKQIDPFLKKPDPKARVVLVYGPDNGLMRERAKVIGKHTVPDLNDPFNVITLDNIILSEDPARLSDEANAISMMGGDRLIRIENGSDKITTLLKDYLKNPSQESLIVVEAGELSTRSSLRKLCESAKNAAALPCYVEDERGIANLIRQSLTEIGLRIDADAIHWLAGNIVGDRQRARNEIEKLITFMGNDKKDVQLADVQASCGEAGAGSLDELIYAVAGAQPQKAMEAFQKLVTEGTPEIVILRTLQNHFKKIHYTNALMASGRPMDEALKSLQPPIFFKFESAFKAQLNKWTDKKLNLVMKRLSDLEAQSKKTGTPVQTLCAQAILAISATR